jgi:hypothetical protein
MRWFSGLRTELYYSRYVSWLQPFSSVRPDFGSLQLILGRNTMDVSSFRLGTSWILLATRTSSNWEGWFLVKMSWGWLGIVDLCLGFTVALAQVMFYHMSVPLQSFRPLCILVMLFIPSLVACACTFFSYLASDIGLRIHLLVAWSKCQGCIYFNGIYSVGLFLRCIQGYD